MTELPRKSWSVGAKKAYAAMTAPPEQGGYGKDKGTRIFYATAEKNAPPEAKTLNQKVSKAFKTGGTTKKP